MKIFSVLTLTATLNSGKTEIDFLVEELDFYVKFLESALVKEKNNQDLKQLHEKVEKLADITKEYSDKVIEFDHEAEGIIECDDLSCEVFFLNAHLRMKDKLNEHLKVSCDLKKEIFNHLSSAFIKK